MFTRKHTLRIYAVVAIWGQRGCGHLIKLDLFQTEDALIELLLRIKKKVLQERAQSKDYSLGV